MQHEPTRFIEKIFSEVPATYELVNHILTFGLDILWRNRAAREAARAGGSAWADLCTGTGETAAALRRLAPEATAVYAVDLTPAMIAQARRKPGADQIQFMISDVKSLPFADQSLDLVTISFATRNINLSQDVLVQTFAEFRRVLRPGGRLIHLETSQPAWNAIKRAFHLYIKLFVKAIGSRVSGSPRAYTYLAHTIPRFYPAEELADLLRRAGFGEVHYKRLLLGIAALHQAIR